MRRALLWRVPLLAALVAVAAGSASARPTLDVERLEVGMKPEAVRALLGEPDWVDPGMTPEAVRSSDVPDQPFPETWPGLRSEVPGTPWQMTAARTWIYTDEFSQPRDVWSYTGLSVVLLGTPLLVDLFNRDGTPGWRTRRTTLLRFEDKRLAEWSFEYENEFRGSWEEEGPGGQLVYDPRIDAYRVARCGPLAGVHCAHYYRDGVFYRRDVNGWCRSMFYNGPFDHVGIAGVPRRLAQYEGTACRAIEAERVKEFETSPRQASTEITTIPEALRARREEQTGAILAAHRAYQGRVAAIRQAERASILAERQTTVERVRQQASHEILAIREAEQQAIAEAKDEPDARERRAAIRNARRDAKRQVGFVQQTQRVEVQRVEQAASAQLTSRQGPRATFGGREHRASGWSWSGGRGGNANAAGGEGASGTSPSATTAGSEATSGSGATAGSGGGGGWSRGSQGPGRPSRGSGGGWSKGSGHEGRSRGSHGRDSSYSR